MCISISFSIQQNSDGFSKTLFSKCKILVFTNLYFQNQNQDFLFLPNDHYFDIHKMKVPINQF